MKTLDQNKTEMTLTEIIEIGLVISLAGLGRALFSAKRFFGKKTRSSARGLTRGGLMLLMLRAFRFLKKINGRL